MRTVIHTTSRPNRVLLALLVTLASATALAAGKPPTSDARVRYQRESAACSAIRDFDNRANCLSEASTRLAGTQPSLAEEAPDVLQRNVLMRCQPLPEPLRADCMARMQGRGTTSGSVDAGGIYRELVTREVGVSPATTAPTQPAPPAPSN
jgi:hypothetical protein